MGIKCFNPSITHTFNKTFFDVEFMRVRKNLMVLADSNKNIITISLLKSNFYDTETEIDQIYIGQMSGVMMDI
jgi:pyruvate-formate lyase-activating enzyme